ncbi:MAG: Ig-like domain-containing protein [Verrucomicrobia bacterium]|nr:Ig-like domain-containing protein [Verrucomicrobiota bacterium]
MNRKSVLVIPLCCIAALLIWTGPARAATTVSCSPAIGATGISPNTQIIFTFSSTMVPAYATVMFSNLTANTYLFLPPGSWTAGNTVLTFIPVPSLPANSVISWEVFGVDATFQELAGTTSGTFTTGTGSGGNGSGTNAFTTFQVGKAYYWNQYSAAAPVPDTSAPCFFSDTTALASNRTALNISLTLPTTISNNLTRNPVHQESYYFFDSMISSNAFEAAYPQGNYTFFVSAAASNQTVQVVLPAGMTQPNPPHVNNFLAAQSLNATQAFTLGWDPFVGGTSTDFISVSIGANV